MLLCNNSKYLINIAKMFKNCAYHISIWWPTRWYCAIHNVSKYLHIYVVIVKYKSSVLRHLQSGEHSLHRIIIHHKIHKIMKSLLLFPGWIKDNTTTAVTLHCLNIFTWLTAFSWGLEKYITVKRQKNAQEEVIKT